jgi:hypothetical protein
MENQLKLLYNFVKRTADMVGVVLLLAAILFASRGF